MPSTTRRRPLPALIFLLALTALTAVVWWRVMNRNTDDEQHRACSTSQSTAAPGTTTLPRPESVTVVVYNATRRAGIAGAARDELRTLGFRSPDRADNDPVKKPVRGVAQLRFDPSLAASARLLQFYFPGAQLMPGRSTTGKVVVSLGRTYTRVATAAEVRAALVRAHLTLEPAPPADSPSSAAVSC